MATRRLKYIVEGQDRASPMFGRVAGAIGALGAVAAAVGAFQIGRKLVTGLQRATQLAGVQELQERKLAAALVSTGQASDEVFSKLKAQAAALQAVTDTGDEAIIGVQALLVQFGVATDKVTALSEATLDLAKTFELDFQAAATLVAKAVAGNVGSLSRYGVELDAVKLKADGAAEVLRGLQAQFAGRARAEVGTYEGAIAQLSNAYGDLLEIVGGPFRDVVRESAQALTPLVNNVAAAVVESGLLREGVLRSAIALASFGQTVEGVAKSPAFQFLFVVAYVKLRSAIAEAGQALQSVTNLLDEMSGGFLFNRAAAEGGFFAGLRIELEKLLAAGGGAALTVPPPDVEGFTEKVTVVRGGLIEMSEAVANVVKDGVRATQLQMDEAKEDIVGLGRTIQRQLAGIGVSAALRFGDTLVDAALGAELSFREFFKQLLSDIAKAIVQALILQTILRGTGFGRFLGFEQGGIVPVAGAQRGLLVPGVDTGRDSVLVATRPGEAILPPELTQFLLEAAGGASAPQPVEIMVHTNLPAAVAVLNQDVRAGAVRLTATDLAGPRNTR